MKRVKESLFEADLNLPKEYIQKVRDEAKQQYGGFRGPTHQEIMQMGGLLRQIFQIQRGYEEDLTEIGKEVIQKFYGPIIEDVELDIKIVDPNDPEKLEMAQRMLQNQQEEEQEEEQAFPQFEMPIRDITADIDKRKLINNIMQGEAQNVHAMMYDVKDRVTEITGNNRLLDLYMQFLALNKKFDWDETQNLERMVEQAPEMANAMETEWEGGEEEGEEAKPKIKARVLDLPMLIHETVKGIYELIAAGAIDSDPEIAKKILAATDSLADEQQDIRYGPYIARDLRNFVNSVADKISGAHDIPNMREFVFGKLILMPAKEFVEIITAILMGETWPEKTIAKFIRDTMDEIKQYQQQTVNTPEFHYREEEYDEELPPGAEEFSDEDDTMMTFMKEKPKEEEPQQDITKKFSSMGVNELDFQLNKAIDAEDWQLAKLIQQAIERKGGMKESVQYRIVENFDDEDFDDIGVPEEKTNWYATIEQNLIEFYNKSSVEIKQFIEDNKEDLEYMYDNGYDAMDAIENFLEEDENSEIDSEFDEDLPNEVEEFETEE